VLGRDFAADHGYLWSNLHRREGGGSVAARSWDWWTEQKLDILGDYLSAFTRASSLKASTTVYLDLFAGQAQNVSRGRSRHPIRGSARRALDARPPFTILRFFELESKAKSLEAALKAEYLDRDFKVVPGDCNIKIAEVLAELAEFSWAPTFAFLDQQSTEVQWTTLQQLARYKRAGKWKAELWLLCASDLLPRGLRIRNESVDPAVAGRMTRMFGTDIWIEALDAARQNLLTGREFRAELTNLMRWRLEQDLEYQATKVFKVTNTSGIGIFDMIFATDHWAGEKIMNDLYSKAPSRQPALRRRAQLQRRQAREEQRGVHGMFDLDELVQQDPEDGLIRIRHEDLPVHPPYRLPN
jgi:three-Cys-motif partner protein